MDNKVSTEAVVGKKANAPPQVITLEKEKQTSEAQTPKHANKKPDEAKADEAEKRDDEQPRIPTSSSKPWSTTTTGYQQFESQRGGAFHPREPFAGPLPMQVSPGGNRYFQHPPPSSYGRYSSNQYEFGSADFSHAPSYPQRYHNQQGGPPPMYHQQQYNNPNYDGRPHNWGAPPPNFQQRPQEQFHRSAAGPAPNNTNNANFSRAVSSSFDRSTNSGQQKSGGHSPKLTVQKPPSENGSVSEDASWGQLKQVHSVDEEEMRRRLSKRKDKEDVIVNQANSNSSSLTNSPTDEIEKKAAKSDTKNTSSLDSLCSVASAQEPMETKEDSNNLPSPDNTTGSLELMKCPSGTSALLLPSHQRSLSQLSLSGVEGKDASLVRKESELDEPGTKKQRVETKDKKASPLTIRCSPPTSPGGTKKKTETKMHQPQPVYPSTKNDSPAFFDKDPHYSYSMDSAAHREMLARPDSYPTVPRPGSSASSTITPMNVEGGEMRQPPAVTQMPSWEIHAQDSFGGASAGGGPFMNSFSFHQDYPMNADHPPPMVGPPPHAMHPSQALESRNQSFEGGHYHGSFDRSNSMMSYDGGRQMSFDGRPGYQGPFPPHAPSWGSAGSYPQAAYPPRMGYPPMMRNYSEDSSARASPPPGGMRMIPPNFPPPPEFRAPPSMVSGKSGPQNTIMTSPYASSPKVGPFGWSKEEDGRLTEIMKKYKNPRDWEPIAKEHNRGRSAKECHERWIRYLKPGVRKGQWTDHEDAVVMEVVTTSSEQPFTRWSDLAQRLPGRVGKQIRDRWVNHLNPAINHLPFSREDDLQLWEGHEKLGKRWVEISTKYFNNTRSENHIKNRWYSASFKKFIANEFGPEAYTGGKATVKKESSSPKKKPVRRAQNIDPSQMQAV